MSESPETSRPESSRASGGSEYTKPLPESAIEYWAIDINSKGAVSRSHGLEKVQGSMPRSRTMQSIESNEIRVVFIRMQLSQHQPRRKWELSPHLFNLWDKHRSGERVDFVVPVVFERFDEPAQVWNTTTAATEEELKFPKSTFFWEGMWTSYYRVPSSLGFNWNDDGSFEGIDCPL